VAVFSLRVPSRAGLHADPVWVGHAQGSSPVDRVAPVRFGERALSYSPPCPLNDDEGLVDFLTGDPQV
jgi:hypothetical protein